MFVFFAMFCLLFFCSTGFAVLFFLKPLALVKAFLGVIWIIFLDQKETLGTRGFGLSFTTGVVGRASPANLKHLSFVPYEAPNTF